MIRVGRDTESWEKKKGLSQDIVESRARGDRCSALQHIDFHLTRLCRYCRCRRRQQSKDGSAQLSSADDTPILSPHQRNLCGTE